MPRFKVVEGSPLGHACCFNAAIVDTTQPMLLSDGTPLEDVYLPVIGEFIYAWDAEAINTLLNENLARYDELRSAAIQPATKPLG